MDKPKIEDGVPIPESRWASRKKTHPIHFMEPGQSYFVPGDDRHALQVRLSNTLNAIKRRHGINYTTRCVEGGVRVWRLK